MGAHRRPRPARSPRPRRPGRPRPPRALRLHHPGPGRRRPAHPDAAGLTMAAFRQSTSREDDPQLHTHAVISSKVQRPDGRWYGARRPLPQATTSGPSAASTSPCCGPSSPTATASPGNRSSTARPRSPASPTSCSSVFSKRTARSRALARPCSTTFREPRGPRPDPPGARRHRPEKPPPTPADTRPASPLDELRPRWRTKPTRSAGPAPDLVATHRRRRQPTPARAEPATVDDDPRRALGQGSTWTPGRRAQRHLRPHPRVSPAIDGTDWARASKHATDARHRRPLRPSTRPSPRPVASPTAGRSGSTRPSPT